MNDKNILVALHSGTEAEGMLRFVSRYLTGQNLRLSLCILHDSDHDRNHNGELIQQFKTICQKRNVALSIKHFAQDAYEKLERQTSYADLLNMEKSTLIPLALRGKFGQHACSIIVIPPYFQVINNVVMVYNETPASLKSIKEFCQVFAGQFTQADVTLLIVSPRGSYGPDSTNETMLVNYLKHFSRNVGVLKVNEPLTDRLMRPVPYTSGTLVVGTLSYLMSQYGEESIFKPLYDDKATLFLPAEG
jgi:hypothetical protein